MNSCLSVYRLGEGGEYVGWQGRPESSVTVRYNVTSHACSLAPRFACFPDQHLARSSTTTPLPSPSYKHSYLHIK